MRKLALLPLAVLAFAAACADTSTDVALPDSPNLSTGRSERSIQPTSYPGNFVSSDDDQVCYDMSALGYIGQVTSEMRGFKIDPPASYTDGFVSTTLSADGKHLDWTALNATVLAFIIKGGSNHHVYNYVGTGFDWDKGLHSPLHRRQVPQISHYNVCYLPRGGDGEGCTPGYWRNHANRWFGAAPTDRFDAVFGVTSGLGATYSLGQAIWAQGGGIHALARHATAGLLNAHGGVPNGDGTTVAYAYTPAQVVEMVQDAIANGTIEATKDLLAAANEAGCPLGGTSAVKVVP
ncbi:MAG TPA: hypothetical protein VGR37_10330 [Longimicrobiaceae bacterium]|nr:hypothetical protein [Longimicrobiaceae bacterium]